MTTEVQLKEALKARRRIERIRHRAESKVREVIDSLTPEAREALGEPVAIPRAEERA